MSVARTTRLNALLQRELGDLLKVYVTPALPELLVTITEVKVAPNLRDAIVFFSVYGDGDEERNQDKAMRLLQEKRVAMQKALASQIVLKYTPVLRFKYDPTPAKADRVMEILAELDLPE
ncbi:MAG: ribosome-binding factor A [Oligosphaeraceae bacterium]|nr:ribosome-binding factor A [Oligosphaeraceae bacterium]